mgnify:CR=1 FL=1
MNFVWVQILKVTIHMTEEYLKLNYIYVVKPTNHKLLLIPLLLIETVPRILIENNVIITP